MFESIVWGWIAYYSNFLTAVGLIGAFACIIHGIMVVSRWWERM